MEKYDLAVVYRIYPGVSKVPIIHPNNKFELSKVAVKSFKESLGDMKVKLWVLLDNCSEEYENLFKDIFSNYDVEYLNFPGVGNYKTFNKQLDILIDQKYSDTVYVAEDDYIFLPNALKEAVHFINSSNERDSIDFLTIYDSLDFYNMKFHDYKSTIKCYKNRHWRSISSTTLSFMTKRDTLKNTKNAFDSYSRKKNFDSSLWMSLTKINLFQFSSIFRFIKNNDRDFVRIAKAWIYCWKQIIFGKKYSLWSPVPSLGTHLDNQGISPIIDWKKTIERDGRS